MAKKLQTQEERDQALMRAGFLKNPEADRFFPPSQQEILTLLIRNHQTRSMGLRIANALDAYYEQQYGPTYFTKEEIQRRKSRNE